MKCPVCKQMTTETFHSHNAEGDSIFDGNACENGHYEFSDAKGNNGGFYVRIGNHEMHDLYAHSVKKCRLQNKIIENWVKRERKNLKGMRA